MSVLCNAAFRSLDDSSNFLSESSAKLRAGTLVDITEIIEHLKTASESARIVREAILSELPDASWQNREELDALVERIRSIAEQRAAVQRRRSCLLALATVLEKGGIVHRRAQRLAELRQLRDHAIDELRSQAELQSTSPALPGPQADQWIEWACGLKEPEDAESLRSIRAGFPRLDDFIANLELSMWMPGSLGGAIELGREHTAASKDLEESRRDADELDRPPQSSSRSQMVSSEPGDSAGERHEGRFLTEPSAPTRSKPQPLDDSRAITKEEPGLVQGRKGLALAQLMVMGRTGDPVSSDHSPEQSISRLEHLRKPATQAEIAPQVESSRFMAQSSSLAVMSEVQESSTATRAESVQVQQGPPSLSAEWLAAKFETEPDQSSFPYEMYGLSVAAGLNAPETADRDGKAIEEALERSQELALARLTGIDENQRQHDKTSADASAAMAPQTIGAARAVDYGTKDAVQRPWAARWLMLIAVVFALLLAAGFLKWRGSRKAASNRTPDAVQSALVAPKQSNPIEVSDPSPAATTTQPGARSEAPVTGMPPEPGPRDHGGDRASSANVQAAKPAGKQEAAILSPPPPTPRQIRKEESASAAEANTQISVASGSINGVPTGMANVLTNVPVVVPKVTPPKDDATSGAEPAQLLRQLSPRYPQQARDAKVEGTVVLEGVVGIDGKLQNLRVVRGDPRLIQSALDAAKQFRYKPGRLHGQPVESNTQISFNFSLTGG
jgi:protein TonB